MQLASQDAGGNPLLQGVKVKQLKVHQDIPDDKEVTPKLGFLMEIVRQDEPLLKKFGQSTLTVAYQGTIKAFHWHEKQDDLWFVATGKALVVLYDQRKGSPTHGKTNIFFAGKDDYKLIVIPAGMVHGYKVLSKEPVLLFYHTTEPYDAQQPDEQRIPWNDEKIRFDWDAY